MRTRRQEEFEYNPTEQSRSQFNYGIFFKPGLAFLGVLVLLTLWLGIFTIDQYERGIVTRQGAFLRIAHPGLNFKMPWVDGLYVVDMRIRSPKFEDMEAFSSDKQLAKLDVSITLEPNEAKLEYLFSKHGTVESAINSLLKPYMPTHTKIVFGRYTSTSAIRERAQLNMDAKVAVIASLGTEPVFNVLSVNIEDVDFSPEYRKSIEENMKAEVEVLKTKNNWENEKVQADIVKTKADAKAYEIWVKAEAEAKSIEAKNKALANSPKYIEMLQAEKWDGKLPTTVLPSTAVPMINTRPN